MITISTLISPYYSFSSNIFLYPYLCMKRINIPCVCDYNVNPDQCGYLRLIEEYLSLSFLDFFHLSIFPLRPTLISHNVPLTCENGPVHLDSPSQFSLRVFTFLSCAIDCLSSIYRRNTDFNYFLGCVIAVILTSGY